MIDATGLITAIAGSTVILTFLGVCARAIYRKARSIDVTQRFTEEMATNHLPHLYHGLNLICDKLDIPITEPPVINYSDFSKKEQ
jgi:hypothetical protein